MVAVEVQVHVGAVNGSGNTELQSVVSELLPVVSASVGNGTPYCAASWQGWGITAASDLGLLCAPVTLKEISTRHKPQKNKVN